MANKKYDDSEGVWRTIGGRRVFIRTGQSLSDAMKESGKFNTKKKEEKPQEKTPGQKTMDLIKENNIKTFADEIKKDKEDAGESWDEKVKRLAKENADNKGFDFNEEEYDKRFKGGGDFRFAQEQIDKSREGISERDAKDLLKQLNDEGSDFSFNEDAVIKDGKLLTDVGVFMPDERGYVSRELEIPLDDVKDYADLEEKLRDWQSNHNSPDSFYDNDFGGADELDDYDREKLEGLIGYGIPQDVSDDFTDLTGETSTAIDNAIGQLADDLVGYEELNDFEDEYGSPSDYDRLDNLEYDLSEYIGNKIDEGELDEDFKTEIERYIGDAEDTANSQLDEEIQAYLDSHKKEEPKVERKNIPFATNNEGGSDDNSSRFAQEAIDHWNKKNEEYKSQYGRDDEMAKNFAERWEHEKKNRLAGEEKLRNENGSSIKPMDIDKLDNYEVYEKADALARSTNDYALKDEINKRLDRIDRANAKGSGYADKPTNELREILKGTQNKLQSKNDEFYAKEDAYMKSVFGENSEEYKNYKKQHSEAAKTTNETMNNAIREKASKKTDYSKYNDKATASFGKVDYYGNGRKSNEVSIDLQLKDGVFTASGDIWNSKHTDIVSGGQNIDEIADMMKGNKDIQEIRDLWHKYHLNDMHAGTEKQEDALEKFKGERKAIAEKMNKDKKYDWEKVSENDYSVSRKLLENHNLLKDDGYEYGTSWLRREIPDEDKERIVKLINKYNGKTDETMNDKIRRKAGK